MVNLRSFSVLRPLVLWSTYFASPTRSFMLDYRVAPSFSKTATVHPTTLRSTNDDDDDDDDDDYYDEDEDEDEEDRFAETAPSSCNVLGTPLTACCANVGGSGIGTGFYRNGYCSTGDQDLGRHTVCVETTDDFLAFSAAAGNDLSTPMPRYMFPGLEGGDVWCLCAQRWAQAHHAGKAPRLFLRATHEKTLDYVPLAVLMEYAIDRDEAESVMNKLNEDRDKLNRLL